MQINRKRLDRILQDHGIYAPHQMNNNFWYSITFPKSEDILKPQSGQNVGNYTLETLEWEYKMIDNVELAQ